MEFNLTGYKIWIAREKIRGKPGKYLFVPRLTDSGERVLDFKRKKNGETVKGSPVYLKESSCKGPRQAASKNYYFEIKYRKTGETKDCTIGMHSREQEVLENLRDFVSNMRSEDKKTFAANRQFSDFFSRRKNRP